MQQHGRGFGDVLTLWALLLWLGVVIVVVGRMGVVVAVAVAVGSSGVDINDDNDNAITTSTGHCEAIVGTTTLATAAITTNSSSSSSSSSPALALHHRGDFHPHHRDDEWYLHNPQGLERILLSSSRAETGYETEERSRSRSRSRARSRSLDLLKSRGAHRCWHKHSTFLDHLVGVADILELWNDLPPSHTTDKLNHDRDDNDEDSRLLPNVGLFHSAYSNSYVNLALLDPHTERGLLQDVIGLAAEELVYLFCSIDRQAIVVGTLLQQGYIPSEGLTVANIRNISNRTHPHHHNEERLYLSPETLFLLVVFTMADIADQYFGWQDDLFGGGGSLGSMIIPGQDHIDRHNAKALWPGVARPGLWMSYVSQLAAVAATFCHNNSDHNNGNNAHCSSSSTASSSSSSSASVSRMRLRMPPVFKYGTQILSVEDDAQAIHLYWNVVMHADTPPPPTTTTTTPLTPDHVRGALEACSTANPFVFEPWVMLAQIHLQAGHYTEAHYAARQALCLQHQWGTAWDKRLSFGAWVAWTRVLLQRAISREPWPTNSWHVNNLGLVPVLRTVP